MRLSNISGNPHEPVVVVGDDPDVEGNSLISRLPAPESVASSDVVDYEPAGPVVVENEDAAQAGEASPPADENAAQAGEAAPSADPAGDTGN